MQNTIPKRTFCAPQNTIRTPHYTNVLIIQLVETQCKNKAASYRLRCKDFKNKRTDNFLRCKGVKKGVLGRIKGYFIIRSIFRRYDKRITPVTASSFQYRDRNLYRIFTRWVEISLHCMFFFAMVSPSLGVLDARILSNIWTRTQTR